MDQIYDVFKSFIDPVFIIFVLLLICFVVSLIEGKKKNTTLFLFFTIILLYGMSIQPVSNYLSYQLEKNYINNADHENKTKLAVIVVLGGGVYEIRDLRKSFLVDATTTRLIHAIKMFKYYNANYLVCSGYGLGKTSNAELMALTAEELGVPRNKIRIEPKSENTYEHAVEFNKLFNDKNIRIGLVTSACHMKRSEKEFRKYFKNVLPLPSDYLYNSPIGSPVVGYIPRSHCLYKNTFILHEYTGQLWYGLKDILI